MTAILVSTCRKSEVFRCCNLRRFRFWSWSRSRSFWQNMGPPALQLMWATSKLLGGKTWSWYFTKAWDLSPAPALSAPLTLWYLQCVCRRVCYWVEVFRGFEITVSAMEDQCILEAVSGIERMHVWGRCRSKDAMSGTSDDGGAEIPGGNHRKQRTAHKKKERSEGGVGGVLGWLVAEGWQQDLQDSSETMMYGLERAAPTKHRRPSWRWQKI